MIIRSVEIDDVIAQTSLAIVLRSIQPSRNGDEGGQTFRIKNLTHGEITAFLREWSQFAEGTHLTAIKVVVAGDSEYDFPENFRADPDKSITWYRNNIRKGEGLLYIETKVESDSSGLRNIFTLRDNNFLDGSFDEAEFSVPSVIFEKSWCLCGGHEVDTPQTLRNLVLDVLHHIHPNPIPVSARKFARFCVAVSKARRDAAGNLAQDELESIVGQALIELDLFPDPQWNKVPSRAARRLAQNSLHAELASSTTVDSDPEKLAEICIGLTFKDEAGAELSDAEQRIWRDKCRNYCLGPNRQLRQEIPYFIFSQLFVKDVAGLPLGDRVYNEISSSAADRLNEFRELGVHTGLNNREPDEAQRFLEYQPDDVNVSALADLLSKQTRRMVERVAFPHAERITNPFSKLVDIAETFRARQPSGDGSADIAVKISVARSHDSSSPTLGLFAFLYSQTLKSVRDACTAGYALQIDENLLAIRNVPPIQAGDNDEENDELVSAALEWKPLPLEFELVAVDSGKILDSESNVEWYPSSIERLSLLWISLASEETPDSSNLISLKNGMPLDTWLTGVFERQIGINYCVARPCDENVLACPTMERLFQLFRELKSSVVDTGLCAEMLLDHFDSWLHLLEAAKSEFVPSGVTDQRIAAFLSAECIDVDKRGGKLMLPSHPFKLRWLAHYLNESERLAIRGLSNDLLLNAQNERMYLEKFSTRSPHQQPAISCSSNREILLAEAELGWSEQFVPASSNSSVASAPDSSISKEILRQIDSYLHSHPHRMDGLSVLVVLSRESQLPSQLVAAIRRGEWQHSVVTMHVLARRELWDFVTESFESLHADNRLHAGSAIFPPVQLRLHEYPSDSQLSTLADKIKCDIAVAPEFLDENVELQVYTQSDSGTGGQFNVIIDEPTYVSGGYEGGAISVSTRPANPDPAIDMWSTLAVRHHRAAAVSAEQPNNTDYVEVQVNFSKTANLFMALHSCAHWVVSVERYLSREQIEALDSPPDILTVREGIGSSGTYTLIVSSNVGRQFVTSRLQKKIRRVVGNVGSETEKEIAENVYDSTRQLAPQLVLQATGISRVTEEILGLAVARRIAELRFPSKPVNGAVIWISLDDHPEWFRGASAVRADLIRLTIEEMSDGIEVDVLVVEGKLRTSYDPHGIDQVATTMGLVEGFLPPSQAIDSMEWRNLLLLAIANVSPKARTLFGSTNTASEGDRYRLPLNLRTGFRDGDFRLRKLQGLFSIARYDKADPITFEEVRPNQFLAQVFRSDILSVLSDNLSSSNQFSNPADLEKTKKNNSDCNTDSSAQPSAPTPSTFTSSEQSKRRLSEDELVRRYQSILEVFGSFNISVKRAPDELRFIEGPASVLYRLSPDIGVDPRRMSEKSDAIKLILKLDEEQNIRFSIDKGYVTFDVPKGDGDRYYVDAEELWANWTRPEESLAAPLGEDRLGKVIDIDFSSANSPHLLIGGTTGSGKSEALNTILKGFVTHYTPKELRIHLVDPKGTELQSFSKVEHLDGQIGWDDNDASEILERSVQEMQRRYQLFRDHGVRSLKDFNSAVPNEERLPWWLIVLDEYADLTSEPEPKKEIEASLKRLAQKARASGIHVIIATQKPSAQVISTNLRANLPAQLALRVKSATESRVVMDEPGAESLNGKGDAFLKTDGKLHRVQCAIVKE